VTLDDLPYAVELMLFLGHKISMPDGSAEASTGGPSTPVIGAVPNLEHDVEAINAALEEKDTHLHSLHKSMLASYNLYNKTRPTASKQSVARSKQLLEDCGGAARLQALIHPAFQDSSGSRKRRAGAGPGASQDGADLIRELRGFRPRAEKVGNVISSVSMKTMEQAKLDASAVAATRDAEGTSDFFQAASAGKPEPAAPSAPSGAAGTTGATARPTVRDRPRVSKRRRLREGSGGGAGAGVFEGWDVQVDGQTLGDSGPPPGGGAAREKKPVEQFYLSVDRDKTTDAKERGLDMEQYQMDLLPDDSENIQRAKSVIRWDAKKKKYLPVMVSVDGRVVKKGHQRNESGQQVKGERVNSGLYKKWAKNSKRRIQRVGELEQVNESLGSLRSASQMDRTVEFDAQAEVVDTSKRKPVVPFHGQIENKYLTNKQKRIVNRRQQTDTVSRGKGKMEVKTAQQIQRDKKQKELRNNRQNPKLGKKKNKEWKEKHMRRLEQNQMKYGARTRSKMLVFEGSKKGKRRGGFGKRGMPTI